MTCPHSSATAGFTVTQLRDHCWQQMANQSSTEQLLELLVQLKVSICSLYVDQIPRYLCQKTTSNAARDILNSQPAIAYALISLMVSVGAINVDVFQVVLLIYRSYLCMLDAF